MANDTRVMERSGGCGVRPKGLYEVKKKEYKGQISIISRKIHGFFKQIVNYFLLGKKKNSFVVDYIGISSIYH